MDFLYIVAVLAAFVLGAWVRQPFFTHREKRAPSEKRKAQQSSIDLQTQNLFGYGMPGYRQKGIDDED